jgi:hypothetical protein
LSHLARGAIPLKNDGGRETLMAVFGNDGYEQDTRVRREVELLRHCLDEASMKELGFGISEDGFSWALVVDAENPLCHSPRRQSTWIRLVTAFLEEAVGVAWRNVNGLLPTGASNRDRERQP